MGAVFSAIQRLFWAQVSHPPRATLHSFSSHVDSAADRTRSAGCLVVQEMEIAVLGLQGAGKSTFVHVINTGSFSDGLMPTVGFNMHKVQRGAVTIKVWDMVSRAHS